MTPLTCDICGGKLIGKPDGIFECENCGMSYSTEWVKDRYKQLNDKVEVTGSVKVEGAATSESLIKRGFIELEACNWEKAEKLFDNALSADPEAAKAYAGMLMAQQELSTKDEFSKYIIAFDDIEDLLRDKEYSRAKKYADIEFASWLEQQENISRENRIKTREKNKIATEDAISQLKILADKEKIAYGDKVKAENELDISIRFFENKINELNEAEATEIASINQIIDALKENTLLKKREIADLGLFSGNKKRELIDEVNRMLENISDSEKQILDIKSKYSNLRSGYIEQENKAKANFEEKTQGLFKEIDYSKMEIPFGYYKNSREGKKTQIIWNALAIKDDKALLISKYGLDAKQYNSKLEDVTWETCSLRKWLNDSFINDAFSTQEQSMIQNSSISADKNPKYSTSPGNATTDKVFLLSIDETKKYFSTDEARKCISTAYAKAKGAFSDNKNTKDGKATCSWWLRSPGNSQNCTAFVYYDGSVNSYGRYGSECVRPALWINLES